jgi:hypothetical protein
MTPGEVRGALLILFVIISSMFVGIWAGRLQPPLVAATRPYHLLICMSGRTYSSRECSRFAQYIRVLLLMMYPLMQGITMTQLRRGRLGLATAWH